MLKKTAIISLVLFIIFSIVFVALIPLATADMIKMAGDYHSQYSVEYDLLTQPTEGIKSVKLTGDWISDLEVVSSADENIHVITDGYRIRTITKLTPTIDENGVLLVDIRMDRSAATGMNLANVFRAIFGEMNNRSHNYIRLELPRGIEFVSGSANDHNYGDLDIEDDVMVSENPEICPVCGDAFCDDPDCAEELSEEFFEHRDGERYEDRLERLEERVERERERIEERAERERERLEERFEAELELAEDLLDSSADHRGFVFERFGANRDDCLSSAVLVIK